MNVVEDKDMHRGGCASERRLSLAAVSLPYNFSLFLPFLNIRQL